MNEIQPAQVQVYGNLASFASIVLGKLLEGTPLLEEIGHCGWALRVYSIADFQFALSMFSVWGLVGDDSPFCLSCNISPVIWD